jgi:hypothetical protein
MTVKEMGPVTVHAHRPFFIARIFANTGSCLMQRAAEQSAD